MKKVPGGISLAVTGQKPQLTVGDVEVIRRKAAGLCIELGPYMTRVSGDMLELADHHGFPLISFLSPVHFVDITMDLHEHIINLHIKALRNLEGYSRDLQRLSLQTQSLPGIIHNDPVKE